MPANSATGSDKLIRIAHDIIPSESLEFNEI